MKRADGKSQSSRAVKSNVSELIYSQLLLWEEVNMKKSYQTAKMFVLFYLEDDVMTTSASVDNLVEWNNKWDEVLTGLGGGEK